MTGAVALAVTAGMLAAFNPCGFALLPGYLAIFVGQPPSKGTLVLRALVVGLSVTAGFVVVFGAVGTGVTALSLTLGPWLSVATMVAGLALLIVGVLQLLGRDVVFRVPRATARVDDTVPGMIGYGVVYATVSLSCTLPVFTAAVISSFTATGASILTGLSAGLAYAAGMGLVLTTLAVVVGALGRAAASRARPWTRHVGRGSGLVVTLAAAYVIWYGWVEIGAYNGNTTQTGPVSWVATRSSAVSQLVTDLGAAPLAIAAVTCIAVAIGLESLSHSRRKR